MAIFRPKYKPLLVTSQATSKSSKSSTGSSSTSHWGSPLRDVTDRDRPRSILFPVPWNFSEPFFQLTNPRSHRCTLGMRRLKAGRSQALVASHKTKPAGWDVMGFWRVPGWRRNSRLLFTGLSGQVHWEQYLQCTQEPTAITSKILGLGL